MDEPNAGAKPDPRDLEPRPPLEAYEEAAKDVILREIQGVPIPFASPRLLWRMKAVTHREKDAGDLVFLRYWFAEQGQEPPKPV